MADAVGFSIKPPAMITNSRAALAATEFARESGRDEALEERIYRAYFNDGENIGDANVVARLAGEAGLDADEVADAIKSPKYEMRLKNNSLAAHQRGVSGVPTFFIGEYPLVGAQSLDAMRAILKRATREIRELKIECGTRGGFHTSVGRAKPCTLVLREDAGLRPC